MIMQFNDMNSRHYGDAKLLRSNSVKPFRYVQTEARTYTRNDDFQGHVSVKAAITIETNDEMNFVKGDKIQLDIMEQELRVERITKKVNHAQLSVLKKDYSVTYTLDLE